MNKKCFKCMEEKDIILFDNNKNNPDKLSYYCKQCKKKMDNEYRQKNKNKISQGKKNWYIKNKGKCSIKKSEYYQRNRDYLIAKEKERYRKKNGGCLRRQRTWDILIDVPCEKCNNMMHVKQSYVKRNIFSKTCKSCRAKPKKIKIPRKKIQLVENIDGVLCKKCSCCQIPKNINKFGVLKRNTNGLSRICKECKNKKSREQWAISTKIKETRKKWVEQNLEKVRRYKQKHKDKLLATPKGDLDSRMSVAIRLALRKSKKGMSWEKLVKYTVNDLFDSFSKLFIDDMNWDKFINGEIEIDHIIPKKFFHYSSPTDEEFKKCWALSNLRPMWASENSRKSDPLPDGKRARDYVDRRY